MDLKKGLSFCHLQKPPFGSKAQVGEKENDRKRYAVQTVTSER